MASTGSGKTVMMASYISRLVAEVRLNPNLPSNVAFVWLAPNTLHLQNYESLKNFCSELQDMKAFRLSDLQMNDFYLSHKDLLFVNWSSLDKEKNAFRQDNERNFNLESLLINTKAQGTEIIVIIEEAHLSAFTGKQAQKVLAMINAKIEIAVTATPLKNPDRSVIIHRQIYTNLQNEAVKIMADDLDYFSLQIARRQENLPFPTSRLPKNIIPFWLIQKSKTKSVGKTQNEINLYSTEPSNALSAIDKASISAKPI